MTENKRFVAIGVEWTDGFIQDHIGDRDLFNVGAVCNLLNDLSEENKQLKMKNNSLKLLVQDWEVLDEEKNEQLDKQNQALKKLKKENEQLKSDLDYFKAKNGSLEDGMFNLERENKKLKDEADDLITSHLSKHYQRQWKNFCKRRGVLDD